MEGCSVKDLPSVKYETGDYTRSTTRSKLVSFSQKRLSVMQKL